MTSQYMCADCGVNQESMDPCTQCGSIRVVLTSVVEEVLEQNNLTKEEVFEQPEIEVSAEPMTETATAQLLMGLERKIRNQKKAQRKYLRSESWRRPAVDRAYEQAATFVRPYSADGSLAITEVTKHRGQAKIPGLIVAYGTSKKVLKRIPNRLCGVSVKKVVRKTD